ncbi:MAG: glutamine-synthetase adenylyltransferase, partial [Rhodoferax sp.]
MTGIMTRPVMSSHSRLCQRLQRRFAGQLHLLPPGVPDQSSMRDAMGALRAGGADVGGGLRIVRQLVLERLLRLDCDEQAPLQQVTQVMTDLAEFALEQACAQAQRDLDESHGNPCAPGDERAQLWIVGMGKLGARELNVSSDIDLIYIYD